MKETIISLYNFQLLYLKKLVDNVPEDRLYEKQLEGYNSAGWLLGHLCVEADDLFIYLNLPYTTLDPPWYDWFKNSRGKITDVKNLPTKRILLDTLEDDTVCYQLNIYS